MAKWQKGNGPILLYKAVNKSRTGAQGNGTVDSYTLPANTMGTDSVIRINAVWDVALAGGTAVVPGFDWGTQTIWTDAVTTTTAHPNDLIYISAKDSLSSQMVSGKFSTINSGQNVPPVAASEDTTSDVVIAATGGSLTGSDGITLVFWTIELFP